MVTKSGEVLDVQLSAIWQRDAHGRPLRTLSVIKETTEQRRLAAELVAEKERIEVTLQSIGDGVVTTDDQGRITYMNPVAEQLVGRRLDEARGLRLRRRGAPVRPRERRRRWRARSRRACTTSASPACRRARCCVTGRGKEYGVQSSVAPLLGKDGSRCSAR